MEGRRFLVNQAVGRSLAKSGLSQSKDLQLAYIMPLKPWSRAREALPGSAVVLSVYLRMPFVTVPLMTTN